MFGKLTPPQMRELAATLKRASLDTATEVAAAVRLGRAQFDALYGETTAMQYVNMLAEQAVLLADLVTTATKATA